MSFDDGLSLVFVPQSSPQARYKLMMEVHGANMQVFLLVIFLLNTALSMSWPWPHCLSVPHIVMLLTPDFTLRFAVEDTIFTQR